MSKYLLLGSAVLATLLFVVLLRMRFSKVSPENYLDMKAQSTLPKSEQDKKVAVRVGDTTIPVEVADTAYLRAKGLSGKDTLAENEGMLFVFPSKGQKGAFWMKGMKFPIDIIFISDGRVGQIMKDVPPPGPGTLIPDLKLYPPDDPYDFVVEVNAGFSDKNGLAKGDPIEIINYE